MKKDVQAVSKGVPIIPTAKQFHPLLPKYQPRLLVVDPVTTKEALMTENGRNNPNIQDGGNAIRYMA
jgi:hypothetical protein